MASEKVLREYRNFRRLVVLGVIALGAGDVSLGKLLGQELFTDKTTMLHKILARLRPCRSRVHGRLGSDSNRQGARPTVADETKRAVRRPGRILSRGRI